MRLVTGLLCCRAGRIRIYTDERLVPLLRKIRQHHPDCAITLSIGEREKESYRKLREAGGGPLSAAP